MKLDLKTSQELCDWLLQRGLEFSETGYVLCDLASGHSLGVALVKAFEYRQLIEEENYDKICVTDWGNPITA